MSTLMQPTRVSYIWLSGKDTHHDIRGKDRTIYLSPAEVALEPQALLESGKFPEWNFDGSSTNQAKGLDTEIVIRAVRAFRCPLPQFAEGIPWYVVLCECFFPNGEPTPDNTRCIARLTFAKDTHDLKPWFGMEQEYVLMRSDTNWPYGFPVGGYPAPQGPYYCGFGPLVAFGRRFAEKHYEMCLKMGIKMSGINAEVMPGQWEFQIGPCEGIEMGDHLIVARWMYLRILELESTGECLDVCYAVKPVRGDWNGSGLHTNFSTTETREPQVGIEAIHRYLKRLSASFTKDITVYGAENNIRLSGKHETSKFDQFTFGVGTRTTSVRIPNSVVHDRCGYFEDRRPGGDADPYLVSARLFASAVALQVDELERRCEELRQPWMPK